MDESTEAEWKGAEKNFLHELDDLYAYTPEVDVAMFPVDPRLGKEYLRLCRSAWSAFCVIDASRTKNRD